MKRTALLLVLLASCGRTDVSPNAPIILDPASAGIGTTVAGPGAIRVCVMTAPDCPISKLYRPKIERLRDTYAGRCEVVVIDSGDAAAARLKPRRTTEAFLIDASGVLRYRGAIDDQYGLTYHKGQASRNYLVDAIDALLAGRAIAIPATDAPGCPVEVAAPVAGSSSFHRDVEPILQRRCQECHRPDEIGPFSLLSYDDVRRRARRIREVVSTRRMPPWHADPKHGAWENDRRLSDAEIKTITTWCDGGAPEGDEKDAPAAREWPKGWRIGTPDRIYTMPKPYDVPAEGTIDYQYFEVKTDLAEDVWIQAMEIRPGVRRVVHHILVFVEYPKGRQREQPTIDGGLFHGYFGVMVPGEQPNVYPDGMAKKLPAGATLLFQIHYTANGEAARDQSSIGLVFAKQKVTQEVVTRGIIKQNIKIPPGDGDHEETAIFTFPHDAKILSFLPHMHVRGKAFKYVAIYPDKTEEVLLDVPAYDFRWQTIYRLKEPKFVKKGTQIRAIAKWDNSDKNPANPDPTKTVRYGEQTWEEMLNGYIDFVKVN